MSVTDEMFLNELARYNEHYWWVRALLTLGSIWLLIDLARKAPWAQRGLKLALAFTCVTVGMLSFTLFTPDAFPEIVPASLRVWLVHVRAGIFLLAGLVGIVDAMQETTRIRLPERGWRLAIVIAGCIVGLGFPAYELALGHVYPKAQAYGIGPAPIVLVLLTLLGASRPRRWTGQAWFWLMILAGIEIGMIGPVLGLPHRQIIVGLAVIAALVMMLRPEPDS